MISMFRSSCDYGCHRLLWNRWVIWHLDYLPSIEPIWRRYLDSIEPIRWLYSSFPEEVSFERSSACEHKDSQEHESLTTLFIKFDEILFKCPFFSAQRPWTRIDGRKRFETTTKSSTRTTKPLCRHRWTSTCQRWSVFYAVCITFYAGQTST